MAINLLDWSSNTNTLTNNGAAEVSASLPFSESTTAVDLTLSESDYLSASDSTSLSITGDLTLEAWVNVDQLPSTAGTDFTVASKWGITSDKRSYWLYIENADDTLHFFISSDGTFTNITSQSSNSAIVEAGDVGNWVHIAASVDVSGPTMVLYKNGSSVASTQDNSGATAIHDNDSSFAIGARLAANADYMDGKMDDVRVWNDIRTGAEISNNYQKLLTGEESGLAAYYPFQALPAVGGNPIFLSSGAVGLG